MAEDRYVPRLKQLYDEKVKADLLQEFGYKNTLQVPRLDKIVVNMGVGEASADRKKLTNAITEMAQITGQKPVATKSKKSVAGFKIRDGMAIGCKVTLRADRMWEFLDRLINIALPRVRDFRGISAKSFDGYGNYAMGLREQIVFPEIEYDQVEDVRGMDIIICTTAGTNEEALSLLTKFNMPFEKA